MVRLRKMSNLRRDITAAGGLYTRAGLAKRWGVSRQAVGEMIAQGGFPVSIDIDGGRTQVWLATEADAWRNQQRAR